jgi:putative methionine-R-sulfoxide reductase with GAF domain
MSYDAVVDYKVAAKSVLTSLIKSYHHSFTQLKQLIKLAKENISNQDFLGFIEYVQDEALKALRGIHGIIYLHRLFIH